MEIKIFESNNEKGFYSGDRPTCFFILDSVEFKNIKSILNKNLPDEYTQIFEYLFKRIKNSIKGLNEKEIEDIFNDLNILNKKANVIFSQHFFEKGEGTYQSFTSPVSQLKKAINNETPDNINWANHFFILALSLISGVDNTSPFLSPTIKSKKGTPERTREIAGELAAYAMEAVDYAEKLYDELGHKSKVSLQNSANARAGYKKEREFKNKLKSAYYENDYHLLKNTHAAKNLHNKFNGEIDKNSIRCSFHTIEKYIKEWKDQIQTSI